MRWKASYEQATRRLPALRLPFSSKKKKDTQKKGNLPVSGVTNDWGLLGITDDVISLCNSTESKGKIGTQ